MKSSFVLFLVLIGFAHCQQSSEAIPEELKCFLRGFFKCRVGLQTLCADQEGNNRRPVPIPKRRFDGECPILGQKIPKVDISNIELPPCPCSNGTGGDSVEVCFTCVDRENGVVLKKPTEG